MNTEISPAGDTVVNRRLDTERKSLSAGDARRVLADTQGTLTNADRAEREERLRETASLLARRDPRELLEDIASSWGLSWTTIATMLGVSASALRKWRRPSGHMSAENREQVALLSAFLQMLANVKEPIADIGSWMEMRIREDTTLRPADVYAGSSAGKSLLLDLAAEFLSPLEVLEEFAPDWRTAYQRDPAFEVVDDGPGGERAIVQR